MARNTYKPNDEYFIQKAIKKIIAYKAELSNNNGTEFAATINHFVHAGIMSIIISRS